MIWSGDVTQSIQCLPSMLAALGSIPRTTKTEHRAACPAVPGTWEVEAKELEVQGHPQLGGEFEVSPDQALAQKQTKLEEQMYKINFTIEFF